MLNRIIKGYGNLLFSALKMLLLLLVCALCGAVLVFPLWKLAVSQPELYTVVVGVLLLAGLLYAAARGAKRFITQGRSEAGNRRGRARRLLTGAGKVAVCAAGFSAAVAFVTAARPVAALLSLGATAVLYGILAFGIKTDEKSNSL